MMPSAPEAYWACLRRWTNGNESAAQFLDIICRIARTADNIADGDANSPHAAMGVLLHTAMVELPLNAFFREHTAALTAVVLPSIVEWVQSEDFRDRDIKRQMFAFVRRESTDKIATTVAGITGGYAHARFVADQVYKVTEEPKTETFEDWLQEGKR